MALKRWKPNTGLTDRTNRVNKSTSAEAASLKQALAMLLPCPAATTYERFTIAAAENLLRERRIPWRQDAWGNLHAGDLRAKSPVLFVAHLDHPGFTLIAKGGRRETARWWGGVRTEYFRDARVRFYPYDEPDVRRSVAQSITGRIVSVKVPKGALRPASATIVFDQPLERARPYVGNWAITECRINNRWVESIRIDDLVGSACIIELLSRLSGARNVRALLTRAEEDGFHGTLAAAAELPPDALIVSIETSSQRPGAVPGKGPIVRQGDAAGVFDPQATRLLMETAAKLRREKPAFHYQQRIMDGGTCEATAFLSLGFRATGMAVPLVNYHNMGRRKLAVEKIAWSDVRGLLDLMTGFVQAYREHGLETALSKRLQEKAPQSRKLLKSVPLP